jgi:pimeloyl-ACP methyl ester carboxylesterase
MTAMETCVEIFKKNGECLRGILHQGNVEKYKKIVLICLNTGLNDMAGWHRIQVKTARFLAEKGFNVLRYDDSGIGDSDGIIDGESIVDIFSRIETGMFVENANRIVDYISEKFQDHKLIYLGFCGGGLTGIFSAATNKMIHGTISIGAPVTLSSNEYFHKRDPWVVQKNVENYWQKIFRIRSWLRFLTFRGDYRTVFTSVFMFLKHKLGGAYSEKPAATNEVKKVNLNHVFFNEFKKFVKRNIPCLFFYAENDSATWEFKKYFLDVYKNSENWNKDKFVFFEAQNANHILSSEESQQLLNEHIMGYLEQFQ